jgi:hypothetical protein
VAIAQLEQTVAKKKAGELYARPLPARVENP